VCDAVALTERQRDALRRVFPHEYALYDLAA
jgi:hypothetical protein